MPALDGRIIIVFVKHRACLLYRYALAVVLPSRIEGFGRLQGDGRWWIPLVADSRGLRSRW